MMDALSIDAMIEEQNDRISTAIAREQSRLRNFIQKQVVDESDAEDILQEVFYELVQAYRLTRPVEQMGAWLFRVARNRITDLFRRRRAAPLRDGPEAAYAREVLLDELDAALDELPEEQREVFVAHELEGRSFNDLAAATGLSVNTLLSRKHYAMLHLRRRLRAIYDEFKKA